MQHRRIQVRSQLRARLRTLRLGHLWAGSYWFGCRWGRREGRISWLPNEMRTNLGLLAVGSTWVPFPEVAGSILTDLLLERNASRKLDFRFFLGCVTAYPAILQTPPLGSLRSRQLQP